MRATKFRKIAEDIASLYEVKDKAYGNSFGATFEKLGIISAVTRISDKYNRLCNLATNKDIDNLGESIEDTLKDMAAYCIMTIMELQDEKTPQQDTDYVPKPMELNQVAGLKVGDEVLERISEIIERRRKIKALLLVITDYVILFEDGGFFRAINEEEIKNRFVVINRL